MADIPVIPGVKVTTKGILNKPVKDIICAILFGGIANMLKGPLLCITADLNKIADEAGLAGLGDLKSAIDDVAAQLKAAEQLAGIPETLARVNAAIAEVQSLLALDGLCAIPLKAPKIPDVIAQVIDAEHRELNAIIKDLGRLAKPTMCLSGDGGFGVGGGYNPDSILGSLSKHVGNLGKIPGQQLDALTKRLKGVKKALDKSINRQLFPDFRHKHDLTTGAPYVAGGGPTLAGPPAVQWNPPYPPPDAPNLKSATATAQALVNSVNQTGSYPVKVDGIQNTNIWLPMLGPEVYAMAVNALTPKDPFFAQQEPMYDYCGKLVGYTSTVISGTPGETGGNPAADAEPNPPKTSFDFQWIADRQCWAVTGVQSEQLMKKGQDAGRKGIYLDENPIIELHRGYNHILSIPSAELNGFSYEYDSAGNLIYETVNVDGSNITVPKITESTLAEEFFICYVNEDLKPRLDSNGKVMLFNNGLARLETYELLEDANGYHDEVSAKNRKKTTLDQFGMQRTSTTLYFAAEQRVYVGEEPPATPEENVWWSNLVTCVTSRWVPNSEGEGTWVEVSDSDRSAAWFGSSYNYTDPHVNYLAYSNSNGSVYGLIKFI